MLEEIAKHKAEVDGELGRQCLGERWRSSRSIPVGNLPSTPNRQLPITNYHAPPSPQRGGLAVKSPLDT